MEASKCTDSMGPTFIQERIPHRPPFLWLDRVLELGAEEIRAKKTIPTDLDVFQGHYPDYPILPGVLLCEAVFQAGALLISELLRDKKEITGVPVLTRILGAKFKREIGPGDTVEIRATLKETIGPAWFMKGGVRIKGKIAVQVEFACALKEK